MNKIKLSVCIPLYNKQDTLEYTFKSLEKNYFEGIEIIVLDNASTDNSLKVVEAWKDKLNIKLFQLPATISAYENWLLALTLGKGEYLRLQLAGDYMSAGVLKEMVDILDQRPDFGFVHGTTEIVIPEDRMKDRGLINLMKVYEQMVNDFRKTISEVGELKTKAAKYEEFYRDENILTIFNPFGDISLVFRSSLLNHLRSGINNFSNSFETFADLEIWLRLFVISKSLYLNRVCSYSIAGDGILNKSNYFILRAFLIPEVKFLTLLTYDEYFSEFRSYFSKSFQKKIIYTQLSKLKISNKQLFLFNNNFIFYKISYMVVNRIKNILRINR